MSVEDLVAISRLYGANPEYVVAGGGNTSFKDDTTLYIKGSGTSLADCTAETFVKMDRSKLAKIWGNQYPEDPDKRESAVLEDMMSAKMAGEEKKRPSVETLLHDMLPYSYVVHTHPALINGITCSKEGGKAAERVFSDDAIWIPSVNPGYILSLTVKKAMDDYKAKHGKNASIIFLQNHGVFVGANTTDEINAIYKNIVEKINTNIIRKPDFSGEVSSFGISEKIISVLAEIAEKESPRFAAFRRNEGIASVTENHSLFAPVSSALSHDHIVYAGSNPLFVETVSDIEANDETHLPSLIKARWDTHVERFGKAPKTVAIQRIGVFGIGTSEKAAGLALDLFCDAIKVAVYTEAFGGVQFMPQDQIDFINNWEVERYRTNVSVGK
ncbi:MAG: class II aldolase/adducin family protein [Treponema sp.]|jgi:rhamnose utilization protein RhaD (predicted bifunctional aldolase and dehydrogenase)|nr:class II aldolase/adducin family protein [Treponema sp.]